jgi:ribosome-binding protein aMBF1 (putative translation factor)
MGRKKTTGTGERGGSSRIDRRVGSRVRLRRQTLDMSQSDVATKLGVSYQQFQKYEEAAPTMRELPLMQFVGTRHVHPRGVANRPCREIP